MARLSVGSKESAGGVRTAAPPAAVVAVMSHHATFAMQMRRAGFEVAESRDVETLTAGVSTADIVVADLMAVEGKRGLVARLRTAVDERVPIVLISADEVDVALLGPGRTVHVVVPPVRADYLVARVRQILKAHPPVPRVAEADVPGDVLAEVPADAATSAPSTAAASTAAKPSAARSTSKPSNVTPMRGREGRRTKRGDRPAKAAADQSDSPPRGTPPHRSVAATTVVDVPEWAPPTPDWRVLANQLAYAVRGVPAVPSVAQAIADELALAAGADAVVIVRDLAGTWRVEGGVGLRSFEWAQTLEDDDWIIVTGREECPSLLVADTDAVRGQLVGAPLASRHQLARTHSTVAPFIVCAAWPTGGDDQERVGQVVTALKRHEVAMSDAMALRDYVLTMVRQIEG